MIKVSKELRYLRRKYSGKKSTKPKNGKTQCYFSYIFNNAEFEWFNYGLINPAVFVGLFRAFNTKQSLI